MLPLRPSNADQPVNPFTMSSRQRETLPYELEFPIDDCDLESPRRYTKGGFHPILLGDRLGPRSNGRFRVVHKLGAGGFGTVWLCEDTHHKPATVTKWRAVKVLAAHKSRPDCPELKILNHFRDVDRSTLDAFGICLPLEYFWLTGPNGRHLALVFPWHGCTIETVPEYYGFHSALIKDMAFGVVESLRFLHSRGLCHGDFRPRNIVLRLLPGADEMPESELLEVLNKPQRVRVIRTSDNKFLDELPPADRPAGIPEYFVAPANLPFESGLYTRHSVLIDLGVSFPFSQPPRKGTTGIPISFAAPESIFRIRDNNSRPLLGPASDIWSLACTLSHLRVACNPFYSRLGDLTAVVRGWEETLGPVPEPYRSRYREVQDIETPPDEVWGDKPASQLGPVVDDQLTYEGRAQRRLQRFGTRIWFKERMGMERQLEIGPTMAHKMLVQERQADAKAKERLPFFKESDVDESYEEPMEVKMKKEEIELFWSLVEGCWRWKPEERVSVEKIVRHPWFGGREPKEIPESGPRSMAVRLMWSFWDYVKSVFCYWLHCASDQDWSLIAMNRLPPAVARAISRIGRFFLALFGSFAPSNLRRRLAWKVNLYSPGTQRRGPFDSPDWETW